jgi:polyisoprenoid-binding protein YceI
MQRAAVQIGRLAFGGAVITVIVAAAAAAALATAPGASVAGTERFAIVPDESQVSYHVGETFFNQDNRFNIAVGVTHGVEGEIFVDRAHPRQSRVGTITVDINQFTSDSRRRDNAIRARWLESARYPTATFAPSAIEGLPDTIVDGQQIPVRISGNLRVRDVTRPVMFSGPLKLQGATLTGDVHTTIQMTDFGFDPPSILGFLRAENQASLDFQFTARRMP